MRLAVYGSISTLFATCAVVSAFRQRANFYGASVYLSKSNACMMILSNFGIFCTVILSKLLQSVFFGTLRSIEIERMHDRLWFTVTETLLALAMFRDEFDTTFVVLFISLIFVKCFHWLAADRVEWMDQSPTPPGRLFHARMISVLSIIWVTDLLLIAYATESVLLEGPSVILMFEMEYIIMFVTCLSTISKYILNSYGQHRAQEHWEEKSTYVFYIELATDFLKLLTYIGFLSLTVTFYGLPINVLRDVYYTARSFISKCNNLMRFRQATRNMNERYPNASREEMEGLTDKTCIICREDMEFRDTNGRPANEAQNLGALGGPNDTPKKLPCGHIFHFHCLRSWLERQQTCPTCRRPVLQDRPAPIPPNPTAVPQAPPPGGIPPPPAPGLLAPPQAFGPGPRPGQVQMRPEVQQRAREVQQRLQSMRTSLPQTAATPFVPVAPNPLLSFEIPNAPNTVPRRGISVPAEPAPTPPSSSSSPPVLPSTTSHGGYPYHSRSTPTNLGREPQPLTDYEKKKQQERSGAAEVARRQEILLNQPYYQQQQLYAHTNPSPNPTANVPTPLASPIDASRPSYPQSNPPNSPHLPRSAGYYYPYQPGPVPPGGANVPLSPTPPSPSSPPCIEADASAPNTDHAHPAPYASHPARTSNPATSLGIPLASQIAASPIKLSSTTPQTAPETSSPPKSPILGSEHRKLLETRVANNDLPYLIPLFDTETYTVPPSVRKAINMSEGRLDEGRNPGWILDPSVVVMPTRRFEPESHQELVRSGLTEQLRLMIEVQETMRRCSNQLRNVLGGEMEEEKDEMSSKAKLSKGKEKLEVEVEVKVKER